ncbi:GNAT family N-acetyltransferase [Ligilactobacillus ruminis]|uniref:GNAT family N-acetyltransferase n=1 Tax=Ligilactobacillus ruminis TaxID=1623 RepID=UPI001081D99F|nr:GNAT family N-acetyltransferase [Ligilactobacillus ruminis]TGJ61210.1 N-acetyltransferase [Ligilactobacillus ruminis]
MTIEYRQTRDFTEEDFRRLFLSVDWESGRYLKRLVTAMRNSTHVISAWDGDRLIGLVRALDDGATIAFMHYVLVDSKYQGRHIGDELMKRIMKNFTDLLHVKVIPSDPRTITFYERYGFRQYDNCPAMVRKNMQNKD